jgi:peptidoglycan-associated lipoprotein
MRVRRRWARAAAAVLVLALAGACAKKQPPVTRTPPPPGPDQTVPPAPPQPPEPVRETPTIPSEPVLPSDELAGKSIDDLNRDSPFQPVFYALDSSELDQQGQAALNANAELLKRYPSWKITIEGHADERGTAEYNLALGERRALAARAYLVALGIAADRMQTVSYGKEFPFDPAHTEEAWARNRRAHFVITAKQ